MQMIHRTISVIMGILFIQYALVAFELQAQKHDYNWVFQDSIGLDFNNPNQPRQYTTSISTKIVSSSTTNACISDSAGRLLFYCYSDPDTIGVYLNANHQPIANSAGAIIRGTGNYSTIILPQANSKRYYVIKSLDRSTLDWQYPSILQYDLVDYAEPGGRLMEKNVPLLPDSLRVIEMMCAIRHANGLDWWVVCHEHRNSDRFFVFFLNSSGIRLHHSQRIGELINSFGRQRLMGIGLYASPIGDKLLLTSHSGDMHFFDFNRCSGRLGNFRPINVDTVFKHTINAQFSNTGYNQEWSIFSAAFSPDGSKLYVNTGERLYQYDFSANDFINSRVLLYDRKVNPNWAMDSTCVSILSLAPNGVIYLSNFQSRQMAAIRSPNRFGSACDFTLEGLDLNGRQMLTYIPRFPNYRLGPLMDQPAIHNHLVSFCQGDTVRQIGEAAEPGHRYRWTAGKYLCDRTRPVRHDSVYIQQPLSFMDWDTTSAQVLMKRKIRGGVDICGTGIFQFIRYQVSTEYGCTTAVDTYRVKFDKVKLPHPAYRFTFNSPDVTICEGQSALIGQRDTIQQYAYHWRPENPFWGQNSRPQIRVSPGQTTRYVLIAHENCTLFREKPTDFNLPPTHNWVGADTITVTVLPRTLPPLRLDSLHRLCVGDSVRLGVVAPLAGIRYRWASSAGTLPDTVPSLSVRPLATTTYTLTATSPCDTVTATTTVQVLDNSLSLEVGSDRTLCAGDSMVMRVQAVPGTRYWWFPTAGVSQATSPSTVLRPTTTTTYILNAQSPCAFSQDALTITVTPAVINTPLAGRDTIVCPDCEVAILGQLPEPGVTYQWQPAEGVLFPNSALTAAQPKQTTTYRLTASNACARAESSVTVTVLPPNEPPCNTPTSRRNNGGIGNGFYYYPNPVESELTLVFNRPTTGFVELQDATARTVLRQPISSTRMVLDVRALQIVPGVYLLVVESGGIRNTAKIVVK
jgi:hypothetical protein